MRAYICAGNEHKYVRAMRTYTRVYMYVIRAHVYTCNENEYVRVMRAGG